MRKFRDGNEGGQITQVGAFVVELDQSVMLTVVSSPQWFKSLVVTGGGVHCSKHAGDELVDAIAFLDQRYKSSYSALVVGAPTEV